VEFLGPKHRLCAFLPRQRADASNSTEFSGNRYLKAERSLVFSLG